MSCFRRDGTRLQDVLQALFGVLSTPAAVLTDAATSFSAVRHMRLACIAAFLTMSQANDEHISDSVLPVPVGDSNTPWLPCGRPNTNQQRSGGRKSVGGRGAGVSCSRFADTRGPCRCTASGPRRVRTGTPLAPLCIRTTPLSFSTDGLTFADYGGRSQTDTGFVRFTECGRREDETSATANGVNGFRRACGTIVNGKSQLRQLGT